MSQVEAVFVSCVFSPICLVDILNILAFPCLSFLNTSLPRLIENLHWLTNFTSSHSELAHISIPNWTMRNFISAVHKQSKVSFGFTVTRGTCMGTMGQFSIFIHNLSYRTSCVLEHPLTKLGSRQALALPRLSWAHSAHYEKYKMPLTMQVTRHIASALHIKPYDVVAVLDISLERGNSMDTGQTCKP